MLKYNKCLFLEVKMEFQHNICSGTATNFVLAFKWCQLVATVVACAHGSDCNLNISFVYMHRILTVYSIAQ